VKQEFLFLLKIIVILIPPSLLTFLEPDTGVVLIYFLITIVMLFLSGIRYRWFVLLFFIIFLFVGSILFIYFTQEETFINIFGNSFFLRVNRLLDWSNKSGYQLENSLISIGSSGLFGHGFNLSLYFPEPQTDFIFAVFASSFGLVGSILLICLIAYFDLHLIKIAKKSKFKMDQYIINGILGMLIYQQFQNIGMTFGLMPITGITLPFISYGGSSLLSYLIMIGIIFNISNSNNKFTNS
jgi:rod shape determining protein RodA